MAWCLEVRACRPGSATWRLGALVEGHGDWARGCRGHAHEVVVVVVVVALPDQLSKSLKIA